MPKNMMKRDFYEPRDVLHYPSDTPIGRRTKSEPTKYSIHFDTKTCKFWIESTTLPAYVVDKNKELSETEKIMANSVGQLEEKIRGYFSGYILDYSRTTKTKKIGIQFTNRMGEDYNSRKPEVTVRVTYMTFFEKNYYTEDGSVIKTIYVKDDGGTYDTEVKIDNYDIHLYSEALEDSIQNLQNTLHNNMKAFILMLGEGDQLIKSLKISNLLPGASSTEVA